MPIFMGGIDHGEGNHLGEEVAEEELEFAMQPALNHERNDPHLEQGVRHPETVIQNLDSLVHGAACIGFRLRGLRTRARSSNDAPVRLSYVNVSHPDVQCTHVIESNVTA